MRKIYFALFALLFTLCSYAQLTISASDLVICDENSDGYATFDLSILNMEVLGSLPPQEYSVAYFETQAAAINGTPALPYIYTNVTSGQQYIYVKVWQTANPANYGISGFFIIVNANPVVSPPAVFTVCNEALPNDGIATFDLTSKISEILGGATMGYTVNFYTSQADMMNNYVIADPTAYVNISNPQTLYVLAQNDATGCNGSTLLTLRVVPLPEPPALVTLYACGGTYDLTTAIENDSYTTTFYPTVADAHAETNPITAPQSYTGTAPVYARITLQGSAPGDPACYQLSEIHFVSGMSLSAQILSDGGTITVVATGVPALQYQIDNLAPQASNIFHNIPYGNHTFRLTDSCGNVYMLTYLVLPAAPTAVPDQNISEGDTLANIILDGEDIQWYADTAGTIPLPLDTVIVAGTTYYATQTIDGYESPAYPYTVSGFAGIDTPTANAFTAYPNPVSDVLTISAAAEIKSVEVYNTLGQLILTKNTQGKEAIINIQGLQSGVYMVKAIGESGMQLLKIIKE